MGPGWTQALRFPAGSHLRFVRTLTVPLRKALEHEMPHAIPWMAAIEGAIVTVESVDATRCTLRIAAAGSHGTVKCSPAAASTFDIHARLHHDTDPHEWTLSNVVIMLGGTTDVYVAERTAGATRQLMRVRYAPGGGRAELAVCTAPFASHLPATVRAMLPAIVVIGRLEMVADEAVA